jgi:hypothetical protein
VNGAVKVQALSRAQKYAKEENNYLAETRRTRPGEDRILESLRALRLREIISSDPMWATPACVMFSLTVLFLGELCALCERSSFFADPHSLNRSVAVMSSWTVPGSKAEWPDSGAMRKSASGQARCKAHAVCIGQTTS